MYRARGRVAFPAAAADVAAYVAYVGAQGRAVATIRRYIANLSRLYRSGHAPDPIQDPDVIVMLAVRALARARGTGQGQAKPLHEEDRDAMVAAPGWEDPEGRGSITSTRSRPSTRSTG